MCHVEASLQASQPSCIDALLATFFRERNQRFVLARDRYQLAASQVHHRIFKPGLGPGIPGIVRKEVDEGLGHLAGCMDSYAKPSI